MIMVLNAVGLPEESIALILPVDWLLDRVRTTVNIWGDCVGCAVVQHYAKKGDWFPVKYDSFSKSTVEKEFRSNSSVEIHGKDDGGLVDTV